MKPWKSILATSEFFATFLTMIANLLDAVSQIPSLPPKVLVGITGISGLLVTVLHHLAGGRAGALAAGIPTLPASEAATLDYVLPTKSRPKTPKE